MADDEHLQPEENEGKQDERHSGPVERNYAQGKEGEEDGDHPEDAGEDRARMQELNEDGQRTEGKEQEGDVRVGDAVQEVLYEVPVVVNHGRACRLQPHRLL